MTVTDPESIAALAELASQEPEEDVTADRPESDIPELAPIPLEQRLAEDADLLERVVTALLFLEPEPVTAARLATGLGIVPELVETALQSLVPKLEAQGVILVGGAGVWRLGTHPEVATAVERYFKRSRRRKLSRAMLETLAIIACQGPVTRAEIEDTRQVNSDGVVGRILELEFIEVVGQKETPGRPLLYGITEEFLRHFGMSDVGALQELLPVEWGNLPRQTLLKLEAPMVEEPESPDPESTPAT